MFHPMTRRNRVIKCLQISYKRKQKESWSPALLAKPLFYLQPKTQENISNSKPISMTAKPEKGKEINK